MNKLEQARAQIDAIDREMAKLYEARLDAVKDVIAYKIENDLPILDSGREQVVLRYYQVKELLCLFAEILFVFPVITLRYIFK
mgnify:CR=1 FL=1